MTTLRIQRRQRTKLALSAAGVALCFVLAAVGCGGGSKSSVTEQTTTAAAAATKPAASNAEKLAYEEKMQRLGHSLGKVLAQIGQNDQDFVQGENAVGRSTMTIGIVRNLEKGQKSLRAAAAQLAAIDAPADVKTQQAALRRAVLQYASELDAVIVQVKKGNPSELGTIATLPGVLAMEKVSKEITAKGYAIL